ncbi:MAG: Dam family site-specific DNA-(adenine-N6)-methyltransferase [Clostridiales Family XIII bacterium]|nr:Dam family site-specific DNA-(adenine-N6)-methyltransferase [Clostridiales Family XIII bacterium]
MIKKRKEVNALLLTDRAVSSEETIPALEMKPVQKTTFINNRRYLGNKYKLLSFIKAVVTDNCENVDSVADIFAGTGAVASAFTDKQILTNDILYSNYICHVAWFSPEEYSRKKIEKFIGCYNGFRATQDNYMSDNFADTFFSRDDCRKIGFIRENIEECYGNNEINKRERALLITSLLYAADKIAKTCGHYDAYRQGVRFDKPLELSVPIPNDILHAQNTCRNEDTNELVKSISADLIYIDPPYNSRQYCDAYHLLENIARWEKPSVSGVARKPDRTKLKSDYCTKKATAAFEDLIQNINARYILLSYNNMAQKGNGRSNAKIDDDSILRILNTKGEVKIFTQGYKPFSAGKSEIDAHEERLFLCICHTKKRENIRSPLNYTGGKYKLLPQLLPLFPKTCDTFVDLFCGGCNVGLNFRASAATFNDSNEQLIGLLRTLKNNRKQDTFDTLFSLIEHYGLSRTDQHDYSFYSCNGSDGLTSRNREPFLALREDFNAHSVRDTDYYLKLYLLIVFAFNNQIRFNGKGEYNLPVGKRDFNTKMQLKLGAFIDRIQYMDCTFLNLDFRNVVFAQSGETAFIYADPPYLITCASYNEKSGWTETDERDLLEYLERADSEGHLFALSNVLECGGKRNDILSDWLQRHNGRYHPVGLTMDYSNSNYHRKGRTERTREVLITNYRNNETSSVMRRPPYSHTRATTAGSHLRTSPPFHSVWR